MAASAADYRMPPSRDTWLFPLAWHP